MYSNFTILDVADLFTDVRSMAGKVAPLSDVDELTIELIAQAWFVETLRRLSDIVVVSPTWTNTIAQLPDRFFIENDHLVKLFYSRMFYPLHPVVNSGFHDPCTVEFHQDCIWLKFKPHLIKRS